MANNVFFGSSPTWTTAANWSTGAAPVNGDVVFLSNNTTQITAGLANTTVKLTTLNLALDFTGRVGVNGTNNQYLQIAATTGNLGLAAAGGNSAPGSSLFNWDAGTSSTTINVLASSVTGSATGQAPIKLLGAALTINLLGGMISVANLPTENATISALNVISGGAQAFIGPGCYLAALTQEGGSIYSTSQQIIPNALLANNGTQFTHQGTAGFGTLTIDAGSSVRYNGSGSVNSLILTGTIDLSGGGGAVTFGNTTMYGGARFNDPLGRASFTNPPTLVNCTRADVGINLGLNRYT